MNPSDEKVFYLEIQPENPFPGEISQPILSSAQAGERGVFNPTTTREKTFPKKRTAVELLSTALNTRSKKILQEFALTQSGGFQIGDFKEGISGDVRLTPNGITGRNLAGLTTFALDTDGNLIMIGELRSGSLITGDVIISNGGRLQIGDDEGDTLIDEFGIVSANNFQSVSTSGSPFTTFTNTSYSTVTGTNQLTLTLTRSVRAFIFLSVNGSSEQINTTLRCSGRTFYRMNDDIDGELVSLFYDAEVEMGADNDLLKENIISKPYVSSKGVSLSAGDHTISLQSKLESVDNFRSILNSYAMSILILGS